MDEAILSVRGVSKQYGDVTALNAVRFDLPAGTLTGLVGPNGSGKTTLLRVLATAEKPDSGAVFFEGKIVFRSVGLARRRIGYVPDRGVFYANLTLEEYLRFFGLLFEIQNCEERIGAVAELTGIEEKKTSLLSSLSAGELQRATVARALIHDPTLLLLDEPLARLDPRGRREVIELFRNLKGRGKTVLFSSHVLSEVEAVSDRVVFLDGGKVAAEGPLERFREAARGMKRFSLRVDGGPDPRPILLQWREVVWVGGDEDGAEFLLKETPGVETDMVKRLVREGVRVKALEEVGGGLEAGYIDIVRGKE